MLAHHLHLIINHIYIVGLGFTAVGAWLCILRRKPELTPYVYYAGVAFGVLGVATHIMGEEALEHIGAQLSEEAARLAERHDAQAHLFVWLTWLTILFGGAGIALRRFRPIFEKRYAIVYAAYLTLTAVMAGLVGYAGALISHSMLR